MAKLVSKTYGDALFGLAMEDNKMDLLYTECKSIMSILDENPDFSNLMNHPKIAKEEKVSVVEAVFKGRVCDELTGFIVLLIQKDRYSDLDAIMEFFIDKVKEEKKIGVATVTTAVALDKEARTKIEKRLLETTQYISMEMTYLVDESLIGGMVIRIKDRVVDSSVASKINEIKKQLMKIQLG